MAATIFSSRVNDGICGEAENSLRKPQKVRVLRTPPHVRRRLLRRQRRVQWGQVVPEHVPAGWQRSPRGAFCQGGSLLGGAERCQAGVTVSFTYSC